MSLTVARSLCFFFQTALMTICRRSCAVPAMSSETVKERFVLVRSATAGKMPALLYFSSQWSNASPGAGTAVSDTFSPTLYTPVPVT